MKRRICHLVSIGLIVGSFAGCQMTRGWWSASRLGHSFDSKSVAGTGEFKSTSQEIRPVSAQQEVPIITADDRKSESGVSRWSKLFGGLTKPKRIPLPRTDVKPAVGESENASQPVEDAGVPTLNDF